MASDKRMEGKIIDMVISFPDHDVDRQTYNLITNYATTRKHGPPSLNAEKKMRDSFGFDAPVGTQSDT